MRWIIGDWNWFIFVISPPSKHVEVRWRGELFTKSPSALITQHYNPGAGVLANNPHDFTLLQWGQMAVIAASIGLTINQTASTMDIGQGQAEDALHTGMAMGDIHRTWQYQPCPNMPGNRVRAVCLLCQSIIIIIIGLLDIRKRERERVQTLSITRSGVGPINK